jgi:hypothetical protein
VLGGPDAFGRWVAGKRKKNMKSLNWLAAAALVAVSMGTVSAHPHEYVGGGDVLVFGIDDPEDGIVIGFGAAWLAAGETLPDVDGVGSVTITDDLISPAGGLYCQDLNADTVCGDDGTIGGVVEPALLFCGSAQFGGTTTTAWDQNFEVVIFVDGPIFGSPAFSTCGVGTDSMGTHGFVNHS